MIDKFFKDKDGNWVIAQTPNWPFWVGFVGAIGARFTVGDVQSVFEIVKIIAFIYWSYLEVFKGDAPWRRLLGVIVAYVMINDLIDLIK
ncbi:hypothetical protein KBB17_02810 [Candidatus Saccharibacteria bacterium]|jgi:hypothetical protein|nr:hypothetical protein [Candidatus Saccharibacteria bacterium]MBP9131747.1 hypothetical protein [Candidatus Saccharibacteria bacterium]